MCSISVGFVFPLDRPRRQGDVVDVNMFNNVADMYSTSIE
jgi:hypothetical protein